MKKVLFLLLAAATAAGAAELKFYLDGESRKAPGMISMFSGIRQVPGKFGKALLIERRTVNSFNPADVILSDGAKLTGRQNTLTLEAGGYATLPLTTIRPKRPNTLSFLYRGEGEIRVAFAGKNIATFKAEKKFKKAVVVIVPETDSGAVRISSTKAAVLTEVMFDKLIGYANTYHAPGKMRTVDRINVKPELFNLKSGAISCWIKAPWLKKDAKHATTISFCDVKYAPRGRSVFCFCTWENGIYFITKSKAPKDVSCGFKLSELPVSSDGWYHFVYNWKLEKDFLSISIIINGEKVFNKRGLSKGHQPLKSFTIGYVGGAYLDGLLDDFGLFSAPLTKEEARKIFTSKVPLGKLYGK